MCYELPEEETSQEAPISQTESYLLPARPWPPVGFSF